MNDLNQIIEDIMGFF